MEVRRRQMLSMALGALAAMVAPIGRFVRRTPPVRYVEAVRARLRLVPRKPLDEDEISRPGRWAG